MKVLLVYAHPNPPLNGSLGTPSQRLQAAGHTVPFPTCMHELETTLDAAMPPPATTPTVSPIDDSNSPRPGTHSADIAAEQEKRFGRRLILQFAWWSRCRRSSRGGRTCLSYGLPTASANTPTAGGASAWKGNERQTAIFMVTPVGESHYNH